MKNTIKFAALGACALAASTSAALAGSETLPGVTMGVNVAAPLPEGVYAVNIDYFGNNGAAPGSISSVGIYIPQLVWSTPWSIAGGRIMVDALAPYVDANPAGPGLDGWYNPAVEGGIHWNFGNGFSFGQTVGVYIGNSASGLTGIVTDPNSRFEGNTSVAYAAHGWEAIATFLYGEGDSFAPSWFNYDLTLAHKFGKMTIGAVAFGSTDTENFKYSFCSKGCEQGQFAVGGMVGYDFGSVITQFKITQDVSDQHEDKTMAAWLTLIKPLWNPEAESLK